MDVNVFVVWSLAALSASSVALLITRDSLFEPVRNWWEAHWLLRIDQELARSDAELKIAGLDRGEHDLKKIQALREEMWERAVAEPGVTLWTGRRQRDRVRPWSARVARLDRLQKYLSFLSCRSCLPVWVYVVWTVITAWWGLGFDWASMLALQSSVSVPVSYAVFMLVEIPLALRWLYYLVDTVVSGDR